MKRLLFLLPLVSLLAPAIAAAEEVPDSDVSHINGQLVKVGEHNEYKHSYKKNNVSTNPLGAIMGIYGASFSHSFHPNVAVRIDANYFAPLDTDATGYELGIGVPIYFRRAYQGVFLEPGLVTRRLEEDDLVEESVTGPQILAGWHWTWDSGLNVAIAAGFGRDLSTDDGEAELFGNGYLRFGYAF